MEQHGRVITGAWLTAVLAVSCAPAPRAEQPTVATANTAPSVVETSASPRLPPSSAPPVASASSAPAVSAPVSSSEPPGGVSPERFLACPAPQPDPRRAVCSAGKRGDQCAACPHYTGFADAESGAVQVYAYGAFSGPYNEALVALGGCEPHSNNWGGTVLVRAVEGGFVPILYVPGFLPDQCDKHAVSGVDRLACREKYFMNGGTYVNMGAVADFKARRIDTLLYSECESGVDVESVDWTESPSLGVSVRVSYGIKRTNDGFTGCETVSGAAARPATLLYVLEGVDYVPSTESVRHLARIGGDQNGALDPEVRKVTGASTRVPKEWLPQASDYDFVELCEPNY